MSNQQKQTPNQRDLNQSVEQASYVICQPKDKESSDSIVFKQSSPYGRARPSFGVDDYDTSY
jgi:hypothetical protein